MAPDNVVNHNHR